ncbi:MAG: FtsX-like permease family protein [Pseudobdellovibrionaceae bacterium]
MKSKVIFQLAWLFVFSRRGKFQIGAYLSFLGLVISVGVLTVAMAVMSGFESALKNAMVEVTGHMVVVKQSSQSDDLAIFEARLRDLLPNLQTVAPFTTSEGVAAGNGKIVGVFVQGMDFNLIQSTLHLDKRIVHGKNQNCLTDEEKTDSVNIPGFIGIGLASRMQLKQNDFVNIVIPISNDLDPSKFSRERAKMKVCSILDMGKNDYNERLIFSELAAIQKLSRVGDKYTGMILNSTTPEQALLDASVLKKELGFRYYVRDWRQVNRNLFDAVALERIVIFIVISILVLVSAFNIASSLFVVSIQRFPDIGLLLTLGFQKSQIQKIFPLMGFFISMFGSFLGLLLGFVFGAIFEFLQEHYQLLSGSVYRVDQFQVQFRLIDVIVILISVNLVCFLSVYFPSKKGSQLTPVEGLKK